MRDIINAPALRKAIDDCLADIPGPLAPYREVVVGWLHRAAPFHSDVKRAHRRKSDPAWAQAKFDAGVQLWRYVPDRNCATEDFRSALEDAARLAIIAADTDPVSYQAARLLRSLAHGATRLNQLCGVAAELEHQARRDRLRRNRDLPMRSPLVLCEGNITGTRCATINDIVKLGRETRNCLNDSVDKYHFAFAQSRTDIWALRDGDRLVAVLEVSLPRNSVLQVRGPRNFSLTLDDARDVARFCRAAALKVGKTCDGLRPYYADAPLLGPVAIEVDGSVSLYAEWHEGVRIEGYQDGDRAWMDFFLGENLFELSFDLSRPLGVELATSPEPAKAAKKFGKKRLRRIVARVALNQLQPTIVQHRLLALAA